MTKQQINALLKDMNAHINCNALVLEQRRRGTILTVQKKALVE